ncbi:hypothetical protein ABIF63_003027 [Bradyrhizobium japonicum]|uniref:Uncharacterized protein n=1 Tax=Bradyrhizobium japonicum TaxID=375 RepID=A0ABV2RPS2_BRAJP
MRLIGTSVYADWASLSSVTDLAFEHGRLDLIGKNREMVGQPLEQVALGFVSGKIANELALGRVGPQLF